MNLKEVKQAINAASENAHVRCLLKYLRFTCGIEEAMMVRKTNGDVAVDACMYNVARSMVYMDFKKLMTAETENLITRREDDARPNTPKSNTPSSNNNNT